MVMVTGVRDPIHYVKQGGVGSMVGWMQPPMATACDGDGDGGQSGHQGG
jgi:hypothetical protein